MAASHNLPDAKLAAKLADLELVERATSSRLARWQSQFPGARTREALLALADASAFLDLPVQDVLPKAEPDAAATKQIFVRAITYANKTIAKLPNFYAKRTTTHFDDMSTLERIRTHYAENSSLMRKSLAPDTGARAPLTRIGDPSSVVVTYRDGREVEQPQPGSGKKTDSSEIGLTSRDEFGPILALVITDSMHGKLFWERWEQGENGPLAVFSYLVSQEISHFTVSVTGIIPPNPSYHGEIAVDPESGTILRVTLVTDYKPPFQASEAAIQVEYGPVQIGNATYTCPLKGVALSKVSSAGAADANGRSPASSVQTRVNDVTFTEYHVFRGEVRIVP